VSYDPSGNYHVPATYEWNMTIERQLPSNILFRAGYVGSRTLHILETQYYNAGVPCNDPMSTVTCNGKANVGVANLTVCEATGGTLATCAANTSTAKFKANTFSSTVQADITDINASYHALQTSVEKRMSHGFTFLANYTYSKSLDDLPFGEGVSGFDTGYSTLPFNASGRHKFDYGPSSFDHTHVFTAFKGTQANLQNVAFGASSGNANVIQPVVGARPNGVYNLKDLGILSVMMRAQRNFNAGD